MTNRKPVRPSANAVSYFLLLCSEKLLQDVYGYWAAKRKRWGKPIMRRLQAPTLASDTNPYNTFRYTSHVGGWQGEKGEKVPLENAANYRTMRMVSIIQTQHWCPTAVHASRLYPTRTHVILVRGCSGPVRRSTAHRHAGVVTTAKSCWTRCGC